MKKIFLFCVISLFATLSAHAQGTIIPRCPPRIACMPPRPMPRPIPMPNALPVKSIKLDVKINGQVATTHVEQVFRNDTPYTLEGTYFFPIPETASIVEFAIWENGKKLVGEVRSREEARRIYDEIVRKQRDPGLLEYAGKDLFQASIFPIPPNSDKKLELTYSQVLKAESGTVAYRYPLGTGRNLWNQPISMIEEDSIRRNSTQQKFGTVSGSIEIVAKQALRNIYSPSHSIETKRKGETGANISFETSNNDKDFQMFYGLSDKDFGMSLLTYREAGKEGYFLLQLSPKDNVSEKELVNKDIVFVLDTSGSMADEGKMEKARSALLFGIKNLREGDRFNVISFAGEEHLMESGLIQADASGKKRGDEFVKKLQPTGGTNINDAMLAAMRQFNSTERPKMLVFMTDGLPTVGESNVDRIIANVEKGKFQNVRLFTFGVGYDVNTTLLDKLAADNSGVSDYIEPKEDLEVKVGNFFTKVNSPVLTDLDLDFGGVQTDLMYPRKLTDLFKGSQITLIGRYKNERDLKDLTLRLKGKNGSESRSFAYENLDFPMRAEDNTFLPRLWATRRVGWLMEQIRANGNQSELRNEIVELGTKYGIVTPYTSYLATDGSGQSSVDVTSNSSMGNTISQRQISRLPNSSMMPPPKPTPMPSSGASAVKDSKKAREKSEAITLDGVDTDDEVIAIAKTVQKVGVKTFYLENGVWVDSEFNDKSEKTETEIKAFSDEYFALVKADKDIAQYLALGEQVVIVWKGKVYRIIK
jgi:Ca-activated chloride channel homolog